MPSAFTSANSLTIGLIKDQTGSFVGGLYFVAGLLAFFAMLTLVLSRSLQRRAPVAAFPHSCLCPLRTELSDEMLSDCRHSRRRYRHGGGRGWPRGAARDREAGRPLHVRSRSFRLGRRVLQEARSHDAGRRPRPDQEA